MLHCLTSIRYVLWQGSHTGVRDVQLIKITLQRECPRCTLRDPLLILDAGLFWFGYGS